MKYRLLKYSKEFLRSILWNSEPIRNLLYRLKLDIDRVTALKNVFIVFKDKRQIKFKHNIIGEPVISGSSPVRILLRHKSMLYMDEGAFVRGGVCIELLKRYKTIGKPLFVSTGMSSMDELEKCAEILGKDIPWIFLHCTSTYPAKTNEVNLRCINSLEEKFNRMVGYSGHEVGLQVTYAAVVMGAVVVERHITLDRSMWGSDQAASVEPGGLIRLVRDIRVIKEAMGDGLKRVFGSELSIRKKLRYT